MALFFAMSVIEYRAGEVESTGIIDACFGGSQRREDAFVTSQALKCLGLGCQEPLPPAWLLRAKGDLVTGSV